ncbi:MAG: CapA family protein [Cellulosilyticaceae bacterium]
MGSYVGQSSYNRFDTVANANGLNYFFSHVKSIFEKDDLTIINLEGPLTQYNTPREKKEFNIKGDPSYVKALTGVEAANLANNHTMDYGKKGYDDTLAGLKKANISGFGEGLNSFHTINGVRIGIIGAKGWSNGKDVKANLAKRIQEIKAKSDLIVVIFHWGDENVNYPNKVQQDLGKYAIDQGAHLVVGSHPHVTQGIEVYKGRNIVYSLGNFCFGANRNPKDKDTFIFQQTFELTDKGIVTKDSKVIPCSISSVKDRNDYRPTPTIGKETQRILGRLTTFSKGFTQSYFKKE